MKKIYFLLFFFFFFPSGALGSFWSSSSDDSTTHRRLVKKEKFYLYEDTKESISVCSYHEYPYPQTESNNNIDVIIEKPINFVRRICDKGVFDKYKNSKMNVPRYHLLGLENIDIYSSDEKEKCSLSIKVINVEALYNRYGLVFDENKRLCVLSGGDCKNSVIRAVVYYDIYRKNFLVISCHCDKDNLLKVECDEFYPKGFIQTQFRNFKRDEKKERLPFIIFCRCMLKGRGKGSPAILKLKITKDAMEFYTKKEYKLVCPLLLRYNEASKSWNKKKKKKNSFEFEKNEKKALKLLPKALKKSIKTEIDKL